MKNHKISYSRCQNQSCLTTLYSAFKYFSYFYRTQEELICDFQFNRYKKRCFNCSFAAYGGKQKNKYSGR